MDPPTARAFAQKLEEETFESHARDALLRDIRRGVYRSGGTLHDPWDALHLALVKIEAPQRLLDHLASLKPAAAAAPRPAVDSVVSESAMQAVRAWKPPANLDRQEETDAIVDLLVGQLVPLNSEFMKALVETEQNRVSATTQ